MVEITAELKAGEERADRRGDSAGQLIAGQVSETDIMGSGRGHEHAKRGRQRRREIHDSYHQSTIEGRRDCRDCTYRDSRDSMFTRLSGMVPDSWLSESPLQQ